MQNVKIRVVWWVRGYPRSPAMSPYDRSHITSYSTLLETMCLSYTIFALQQVVKSRRFQPTLSAFGTPVGVSRSNFVEIFGTRKQ